METAFPLSRAEVIAYLDAVPLKETLEAGLQAAVAEQARDPKSFLAAFYAEQLGGKSNGAAPPSPDSVMAPDPVSHIVQLVNALSPGSVAMNSLDALEAAVAQLRSASGKPPKLVSPRRSLLKADLLEIGANLGLGAFGCVFAGRWRGIDCALKFINQPAPRDAVETLLRESDLMESLDHPNVLRVYGVCVDGDPEWPLPPPCICCELLQHGTLMDFVKRHDDGKSADAAYWQQVVSLLGGAAAGLAYLHEKNVMHRDMKCVNLLLDAHDVVKICDFGLSTIREIRGLPEKVGTLSHMAPEVMQGMPYGLPVDAFSFGIVLSESVTPGNGRVPERSAI